MQLTSELQGNEGLQEKINKLFVEDITDAMSISGNSGIKKLRLIEKNTDEIKSIKYNLNKNTITAIVELCLQWR